MIDDSRPRLHARSPQAVNLVFQGGGVKAAALAGALQVLEPFLDIRHCVGTSAGSVVASLISAGYTAKELWQIMRDEPLADVVGLSLGSYIRAPLTLLRTGGLFDGRDLSYWLDAKLRERLGLKRQCLFKDLPRPLTVIATDLRRGGAIIFDRDQTAKAAVAWAVMYSSTIPYLFSAYERDGAQLVDGGLVWNFALSIFDQDPGQSVPTLGLALEGKPQGKQPRYFVAKLIRAITSRHGVQVRDSDRHRVVSIPTHPIAAAAFHASQYELTYLYENGRRAALHFLAEYGDRWNLPAPEQTIESSPGDPDQIIARRRRRWQKRIAALLAILSLALAAAWYGWRFLRVAGETHTVKTYAGTGERGDRDKYREQATFNGPSGVAITHDGAVIVADSYNDSIRLIQENGNVDTLFPGYFNDPFDATVDSKGRIYVADLYNHEVKVLSSTKGQRVDRIEPLVVTFNTENGEEDGGFSDPMGVALLEKHNILFVADSGNSVIRWVNVLTGEGGTLTGPGEPDLDYPQDVECSQHNGETYLFIADTFQHRILRVSIAIDFASQPPVTAVSKSEIATGGVLFGTSRGLFELLRRRFGVLPTTAEFLLPYHIGLDRDGDLLVSDYGNGVIWKVEEPYRPKPRVVHVAGGPGIRGGPTGFRDGPGSRARFSRPIGIAVGSDDRIFIADDYNHRIRVIEPLNLAGLIGPFNILLGLLGISICALVPATRSSSGSSWGALRTAQRRMYFSAGLLLALGIATLFVEFNSSQWFFWIALGSPVILMAVAAWLGRRYRMSARRVS